MGRKRKAEENDDHGYIPSAGDAYVNAEDAGATSSQEVAKPKRKQKKKDKEPAEEKRLARFKAACPKSIQERVDRVRSQRFYMIDRSREGDELKETFKVLGSTGNVYTVTIEQLPKCDCPDATKGNHCKHLVFILLKVLNVDEASGYHYQKALLTTELATIFANAPEAPNSAANNRLRAAYAEATGKASPSQAGEETGSGHRNVDGEDCPICYEEMKGKTEAELTEIVFCETCQNGLHKDCFNMWALKPPVTCVYCRTPWVTPGGAGDAGPSMEEGYLNLSRAAGANRERDTSSYYDGPVRKGQKRAYWMERPFYY